MKSSLKHFPYFQLSLKILYKKQLITPQVSSQNPIFKSNSPKTTLY